MTTHARSLRYPLASAALAALLVASTSAGYAANIYWDGNGTSSQTGVATAWTSVNFSSNATDTTNDPTFNGAPVAADTLIFNVTGVNTDQNMSLNGNRTLAGLIINSTGNVSIASHPSANTSNILTLGSGGLTINSGSGNFTTVSNNSTGFLSYRVAANQSWTNNSNNLVTMNGGISNSGNATAFVLTLAGSGSGGMTLTGPISNNGTVGTVGLAINNTGGGITTLSGTNTFTGGTTVTAGTVRIGSTTALGASASAVSVASGASLDLNGIAMANTNALTLNGTGISSGGALRNGSATNATYAGLVSLGSDSSIIAATGNITLSSNVGGTITGSGFDLTVGGAKNTTISSVIGTGTGSITKQDAGALTLSGGSQSKTATAMGSGNTTIPMGDTTRILVGQTVSGTNIPAGTYVAAISANTSITLSQATAGTGNSGTTLTIAGSTYSGGTNVTGGTLLIGSSSSFSGVGTLSSGPTGTGNVSFSNGTTLASTSGGGQSLYAPTINIGGNITIGGSTTTTGRISLAGTIDLGNGNRTITLGKASTNYASGQEVLRLEGVTGFAAANIIQNGSLLFTTITGNATNPSIVRSGSGAVVNFANNLAMTLDDGVAYSSGVASMFGTGANAPALTLNAAVTRGGGVLQMGDGTTTMRNAEVYSLAGGGTVSVSNSTSGSGTLTINNGNGADFSGVIQGVAGNGTIAVVKSGAGTQTLSGNNTYTGLTTVSAGTLKLGHTNALGATSAGTVVSGNSTIGGVLDLNGQTVGGETLSLAGVGIGSSGALVNTSATSASFSGPVTLAANTSIGAGNITLGNIGESGTRSLTKVGAGTLVLSGTNSYNGGTTVADGTLEISGGNAAPGSFTVGASVPNAVLRLSNTAALATNATLAGVGSIANTGTLDLAASGNYTLGAYNSGHMKFTASSGDATTLNFTNPSVLTSSTNSGRTLTNSDANLTIVFGSTLDISSSTAGVGLTVAGSGNTTFNGAIFNSSNQSRTLDKSGTGTLTLNGDNNYQGDTTITGSGRVLINGDTTASTGAVNVGSSASLGGSGIVGGAVTLSSNASIGSASNTLALASTLATTGTNTLNADSTVNVAGGTTITSGTFTVNGTLGGGIAVGGSGNILNGSGAIGGTTTVNGGTIEGSLSLTTLVATGNSTIASTVNASSGTSVQNGVVLSVNGTLGGGTLTIESGATLKGDGTVSGDATIQSGAFLKPGNSPASLTVGGSLYVAGTVEIELGGTAFTLNGTEEYDRIKLSGATATLDLTGSTLDVQPWLSFVPTAGDAFGIFQLEAGASIASTLGGFAEGATVATIGGMDIKITYVADFGDSGAITLFGGNDIALYTPIPEPSAYAAIAGLGMIGVALYRRRRQQKADIAA